MVRKKRRGIQLSSKLSRKLKNIYVSRIYWGGRGSKTSKAWQDQGQKIHCDHDGVTRKGGQQQLAGEKKSSK